MFNIPWVHFMKVTFPFTIHIHVLYKISENNSWLGCIFDYMHLILRAQKKMLMICIIPGLVS